MSYRGAFTTVWTAKARVDGIDAVPCDDFVQCQAGINLAEANALLADPNAAELRAREILKSNAVEPVALYLLGAALNRQGRYDAAKKILEPLSQSQPQSASVLRELGFALGELGDGESATAALLRAIDFDYLDEQTLFALGDLLRFQNALPDPEPEDARVAKRQADLLLRQGRWSDAEPLYERGLELAPDFAAARFRYATMLFARRKFEVAQAHIEELLRANAECTLLRALKAVALVGSGRSGEAITEFDSFIEKCPDRPGLWLEYGRVLRSNRDSRAAAALKRAIRILPSFVEAYVLYASIKPFDWDASMIEQVRGQLARPDLAAEDRALLHFSLGKAYEDLGRYAESFENYRKCNEILRRNDRRTAKASANFVRRTAAVFNPMLFRKRAGAGFPTRDPIFIVGMKRSGSTLVEQILSRHSAIEALGELDDLTEVIGRVRGYPNVLRDLEPGAFSALGKQYVALAAPRRKSGKPFFTDKLPHNFGRVGLIHLILPNARIIDVRRHPLDCGLSCYKHYFPGGQISLSLTDFAGGYVDYVRLMAHFDRVLPGKVHRVIYERLVGNFEDEVRRLLDYLGLPFEKECLRFHEESRSVLTPSADQVRTPLYRSAVEYWRHYEQWLGPMKEKLGHVLDIYPEVPKFFEELHVRLRKPLSLGEAGAPFNLVRGLRAQGIEIAGTSSR
jgi:tetratricopeptide (TPR) repeat protein